MRDEGYGEGSLLVKAGGKRIVQKHHGGGEHPGLEKDKESTEWESGTSPPKPALVIAGAVTRGDRDFPPAASQAAHRKPQPSLEKLPPQHHNKQHIHQPRK
ncbi:death-associated protein 1-like isoform X2 [Megalops cyprinoides]|uniref:death-associated protein 1-like isoform X2 n=1 Tax=Megalops cyprinoides TaxID=118141 RepID=UPI0018640699|nr:death-associated protein 1-like isoform X2 [Megalops cyprinoides]